MPWSRARDVALGAGLLAAVLVSVWALRSDHGAAVPTGSATPVAPRDLAVGTEQIRADVRADGTILVTHWARTAGPVDRVRVETPPDGVQIRGLEVGVPGSPVVSPGAVEGDLTVSLDASSEVIYLRYELVGAVVRGGSAPGRSLAEATFADVDLGSVPRTRLLDVSGGTVRALACSTTGDSADGAASPEPCGRQDGAGWQVRLPGDAANVVVAAQVDLPTTAAGAGARGSAR